MFLIHLVIVFSVPLNIEELMILIFAHGIGVLRQHHPQILSAVKI